MELRYKIVPAINCSKQDVLAALQIYCDMVDNGSLTDTNQVKDYIFNEKAHRTEKRRMFFYIFYDANNDVQGYAEFAYLSDNQVLMLDYLCTKQRNHMFFYLFYHMVIEEITNMLKGKGLFIRFLVTELSLTQSNGSLIDKDSNYFRHLLSNEGFLLLKYPYYQPPLHRFEQSSAYNLAIKLNVDSGSENLLLDRAQYLSIVKEIYYSHYLAWYQSFPGGQGIAQIIKELPKRIEQEMPVSAESEAISFVNCNLFEKGKCPKYSAENMTLQSEKAKKLKTGIFAAFWIMFSLVTFIICFIPYLDNIASVICSFFTIISGLITIVSFRREFSRTK